MRPKTPRFPRFSGAPRLKVMACSRSALTPGVGSRAHRRRSRAQVARRGTEERSSLLLFFFPSFSLSLSPLPSFVPSRSLHRAYGSEPPCSPCRGVRCKRFCEVRGGPGREGEGEVTVAETVWGNDAGSRGGEERTVATVAKEGERGGQSGGRPAVTPARLSPKSESERASRDCAPPC